MPRKVSAVRRLALLAAATVVAAAATAPASTAAPIQVKTTIAPDWIYFADQVTARVDVVVDRTQVKASSLNIAVSFAPWEESGDARTTTAHTAAVAHRTVTYTLRCIVVDCLPRGTVVQRFHLPVVTVTAESVDGGSIVVKRPWPPVNVAGRFLPPVTGAVRPQLLLETRAPSPRFAVSLSATALAFDLGAAALGLAALALAALELRHYVARRRHPVDDRPPLLRALELVRQAQTRDVEDRRRAAALVARLLPKPDAAQTTAAEIAWSKPDPSPNELGELAAAIEARLNGR
jgi:hypothetical protein